LKLKLLPHKSSLAQAFETLRTDKVAPGGILGIYRDNLPDEIEYLTTGHQTYAKESPAIDETTYFDLASLTKILVTTPLVWKALNDGKLNLGDSLYSFFPSNPDYQAITIEDLLFHRSGLVAHRDFWKEKPANVKAMKKLVEAVSLENPVGKKIVYSDLGFLFLGWILEEVYQEPLDHLATRLLFKPCGSDLHYNPVPSSRDQSTAYAPTEVCPHRGKTLQGEVHDDNCWWMGGVSGHSGLFGRLQDVVKFWKYFRNGLLPAGAFEKFAQPRFDDGSNVRGLGFDVPTGDRSAAGSTFSKDGTIGHLGYTGTSLWFDNRKGVTGVLLTNRVHPTRENNLIREFRPKVYSEIK
jgi:serine-type D-Ala-D-Ala carboxypeptidase